MPVATAVAGDACGAAVIALLDVAADHGRQTRRDRSQDAPLDVFQMLSTSLPKRFAVAAEDIRHFQES